VNAHAPILITGAHRTGTTWAGKMLAASPQVAYISEPLNVWHRPGVLPAPVSKWYTLICEENEAEYLPAFHAMLGFHYGLWNELRSLRSGKDFLRMGRDFSIFLRGRLLGQRPLIKDPFAVFSAPWFAERLGCRVVITVRHPAGFASSLKRLDWRFDFQDLLGQPLLMRRWLSLDRAEMVSMQTNDVIGQAALLWRMVYRVVARMMKLHPSFVVVRHEDLSLDPLSCYRDLYAALDLDFTSKVEGIIMKSSSSENPAELSKKNVHAVKLDSRANLDNWKKRLNKEEIARVRKITGKTARLFYSEEEW
jgi:Sulfotransferase family